MCGETVLDTFGCVRLQAHDLGRHDSKSIFRRFQAFLIRKILEWTGGMDKISMMIDGRNLQTREDAVFEVLTSWIELHRTNSIVVNVEVQSGSALDGTTLAETMWADRKFTDMVIVTEDDAEIPCHKCVMAASSPVFDKMLSSPMKESSLARVLLKGDGQIVQALLQYMYIGSLPSNILQEEIRIDAVASLLQLADMYQMPQLLDYCSALLSTFAGEQNVIDVLRCLGRFKGLGAFVQICFDAVMAKVNKQPELLRVVCMYPATLTDSGRVVEATNACVDPIKVRPSFVVSDEPSRDSIVDSGSPRRVFNTSNDAFDEEPSIQVEDVPDVTQEVPDWPEQPAQVDEEEAAAIEQERWASMVEARIAASDASAQTVSVRPLDPIRIKILHFKRHPQELTTALLHSTLGVELMAYGANLQPAWANGAKIMVAGLSIQSMEQTDIPPSELRPWHVLVKESDESRVHEALSALSYRVRPRLQLSRCRTLTISAQPSENYGDVPGEGRQLDSQEVMEVDRESIGGEYEQLEASVQNTFIHFPVREPLSPRTAVTN